MAGCLPERTSGDTQIWWGRASGNCHGGASGVHQANAASDFVMWGKGSIQERCHPPASYVEGGLNPGKMAAIPLAPALKPSTQFLSVCLQDLQSESESLQVRVCE